MDVQKFFAELKRRNVYKVAVAYAVVGWLLIQVATQVFPFFEVPNGTVRLVVLLIAIGCPIALVMAWAFELTPGVTPALLRLDPYFDAIRSDSRFQELCREKQRRPRAIFSPS